MKLSSEDYKRLGKNWRRRIEAALYTLIDAEGALHDFAPSGMIGGSLAEVCDGLRAIEQADGVEKATR